MQHYSNFQKIQKARQGSKYFKYNASSNNCQYFIRDALQANGVTDPTYINFVKQDTESILKNHPIFRKIANSATDLGAAVHTVVDPVFSGVNNIKKKVKKNVKNTVKKFFGGNQPINSNKLKVKELKQLLKHKNY